ncbi:MAG: 50S ribosomal protein L3 [Candidatus Hydrogenedentota bacterium]
MKGLIGKKLGMTQLFDEQGKVIPVTVIEAGPCYLIKKIKYGNDKYETLQLGFDTCKEKSLNNAESGIFKKVNVAVCRVLKELKFDTNYNVGDQIKVDIFNIGEMVNISGLTKGRGFTGAVKRYGFSGFGASHGTAKSFRGVGSRGTRFPQHSRKGTRGPGHYGCERVTVRNLKIVDINKEENLIFVKGAVPGANGSYLQITTA